MIGKTVAHFTIVEKLGEGGMGVVFKARDTKLDRFVALKFLPPQSPASAPDSARFVQEARAAASLNHPNVCSVIDIQEYEGRTFIVMEFVNGQTLRELTGGFQAGGAAQVRNTPLQAKRAIDIGIQVADGLAAAHEKGIVHRDIKPENIMVRKDGIVQVMDFGLAKLRGTSRLTREGSTVGTAGYMSPEQIQGQEADHRSDIFSLGVVLYELFTGELPFKGVHETAVSYEIVNVDPLPMSEVHPDVDPALDAIVLECLAKEPSERYQSVAEIGKELRRFKRESTRQRASRSMIVPAQPVEAVRQPRGTGSESPPPPPRQWIWKAVAALSIALAGLVAARSYLKQEEIPLSLHVELLPPATTSFSMANGGGHFALSPDGKNLAFAAVDTGGKTLLWVRSLQSSVSRTIAGTDDAQYPFWSPDGKSVGCFSRGKLVRVDIDGGALFTIADVVSPRGGAWNSDGIIVFAPDQSKGLFRVPAVGGKAEVLTKLDTSLNELTHRWPHFLPDQDHYLFFARGSLAGFGGTEKDHLYVGSLSQGTTRQVMSAVSDAVYADGMVLYVRENSIVGQTFDLNRLEVSGDPVTIAQDVQYTPRWSKGSFGVSRTGMLCYQPGGQESRPDIVLLRKDGSVIQRLGRLDLMFRAAIAPGGKRLAMDLLDAQSRNIDIWIYDVDRGIKTRLTFSKQADLAPIWSPDGQSVAYASGMGSETRLVTQPVSGSGQEKVVVSMALDAFPTDWSADNKYLLYYTRGDADIWVANLAGDVPPVKLIGSEFSEMNGRFSPDMRWIAYQSDESGKNEVYVRSFVPPGSSSAAPAAVKRQISVEGGTFPRWTKDGRALLYVVPRGIMMAELKMEVVSLDILRVTPFSSVHLIYFGDILPAQDLIVNQSPQIASGVVPLSLILNWPSVLRKRP